jgi:hypothetical protein
LASHQKLGKLNCSQIFVERPFTDFPFLSFTEKGLMAFRFWLFHMTGGVRSIGWVGFNNRLHSDRFFAASQLQTGAWAGR